MILKQKIHHTYVTVISNKLLIQYDIIKDLEYSIANETKSTAGDKYETSLAMLQIEMANELKKKDVLNELKLILTTLDPTIIHKKVQKGSVVKSGNLYFYLSAALGKIIINDIEVIAISTNAPIAKLIINLTVGDQFKFNNQIHIIESII